MKRKLIAMGMIATMVCGVTACGGSEAETPDTPDTNIEQNVDTEGEDLSIVIDDGALESDEPNAVDPTIAGEEPVEGDGTEAPVDGEGDAPVEGETPIAEGETTEGETPIEGETETPVAEGETTEDTASSTGAEGSWE